MLYKYLAIDFKKPADATNTPLFIYFDKLHQLHLYCISLVVGSIYNPIINTVLKLKGCSLDTKLLVASFKSPQFKFLRALPKSCR